VLGVDKVAAILRSTPSALRRAIKVPDSPMPPANPQPLRWTEGQIERLLWAPQDHDEHVEKLRRQPKAKRSRQSTSGSVTEFSARYTLRVESPGAETRLVVKLTTMSARCGANHDGRWVFLYRLIMAS